MINRRAFVLAGAAGLAAATTLTSPAIAAGASRSAVPGARTAASDGRFDLTAPAVQYLREKTLYNSTILQSFAFDDVHRCIFAVQLMEGGIQLPDEPGPVSGGDRSARGDMCLTRLGLGGEQLGHMYLRGFGHGASIGVEPGSGTSYIWTEADANPDSGYGTAVARFSYVDGAVLDSGSSAVDKIYVVPGSTSNRPAVDVLNRRLLVQYMVPDGGYRYRVLDLDRAKRGDLRPLFDIPRVGIDDTETPQGVAILGDHVYQMTGTHYTDESGDNPPSGHGNAYLSRVHLPTSRLEQRIRTEAAYSLDYREPEGIAIQLGPSPRLHLGFASGVAGARKYTLYYKSQS
ncbi:hypothetical protein GCM10018793_04200 [Streptomyces sulfonofaciens]|uniref:P68 RBP/TagC-like beta-propeller domain-containing protein n=1 Tax=Streptomyces sulfonofaciens TaxID=68272 RepID=A0A919KSE0_9ACTN|nr:teichoic acid biosynthesis protein C [Streptomyces sulfonofaciens]GHH70331.1 hypothetical protein GCM10018793_04200 [Streptomyces sulfonofaciens]